MIIVCYVTQVTSSAASLPGTIHTFCPKDFDVFSNFHSLPSLSRDEIKLELRPCSRRPERQVINPLTRFLWCNDDVMLNRQGPATTPIGPPPKSNQRKSNQPSMYICIPSPTCCLLSLCSVAVATVSIPPRMVQDQFGMMGLLTFIRGAETDPNLVALALGRYIMSISLHNFLKCDVLAHLQRPDHSRSQPEFPRVSYIPTKMLTLSIKFVLQESVQHICISMGRWTL